MEAPQRGNTTKGEQGKEMLLAVRDLERPTEEV